MLPMNRSMIMRYIFVGTSSTWITIFIIVFISMLINNSFISLPITIAIVIAYNLLLYKVVDYMMKRDIKKNDDILNKLHSSIYIKNFKDIDHILKDSGFDIGTLHILEIDKENDNE